MLTFLPTGGKRGQGQMQVCLWEIEELGTVNVNIWSFIRRVTGVIT